MKKKILVTGGLGYVGTLLSPKLRDAGYEVTILDSMIFGNQLECSISENIRIVRGDICDIGLVNELTQQCDVVIHLAALSNDASSEIDEEYTKMINYEASRHLIDISKKNGVKHFIFASSASVYGILAGDVTEKKEPNPITLYGKLKLDVEKYLMDQTEMPFTIVRPATLCGYSPRLRLDLSVNILTYSGYFNNEISVFGGTQSRPNLNVNDMVRFYLFLLKKPLMNINRKVYNVSYSNHTIYELAEMVQERLDNHPQIVITPTNDMRSYCINANKIRNELGFECRYTIDDAIDSLKNYFSIQTKRKLDGDIYRNVRQVKKIFVKEEE